MPSPVRRSRASVAGLGALAVLTLTGCELPDVSMSPSVTPSEGTAAASPSARPSPAPSPSPVAARATATRPSGDLDAGTLTRKLPAGSRSVVLDYWTDEDAAHWTADAAKSLRVSAHIELAEDDTVSVYGVERLMKVTRFAATVDDGSSRSVVAEDRGEFAVMPPYSYTTALILPPSPTGTSQLVLSVQFDLLVETEPGSGVFFRQTVLDSLRLPLTEELSQ